VEEYVRACCNQGSQPSFAAGQAAEPEDLAWYALQQNGQRRRRMAIHINTMVLIARPVEEVFALLLDIERSAATDPNLVSVAKTPPGPIGVGTTYVLRQRIQGKVRQSTMRLTEIEPHHLIAFAADLGPLEAKMRINVELVLGGTRVSAHGEGVPRGILRLFSRRLQGMGQRVWDMRLAQVKAALEG
jgi:Polyketide cyclase / dehydrase and lipid transport